MKKIFKEILRYFKQDKKKYILQKITSQKGENNRTQKDELEMIFELA